MLDFLDFWDDDGGRESSENVAIAALDESFLQACESESAQMFDYACLCCLHAILLFFSVLKLCQFLIKWSRRVFLQLNSSFLSYRLPVFCFFLFIVFAYPSVLFIIKMNDVKYESIRLSENSWRDQRSKANISILQQKGLIAF